MLSRGILVWYAGCSMAENKALQRVINSTQKITGAQLPSLADIYSTRCLRWARSIIKDSSHPGNHLFTLFTLWKKLQIPQDTHLQTPEQFLSSCHLRTELQITEGVSLNHKLQGCGILKPIHLLLIQLLVLLCNTLFSYLYV